MAGVLLWLWLLWWSWWLWRSWCGRPRHPGALDDEELFIIEG